MCGIVGVLAPDLAEKDLIAINNLLIHRGPDDGHHYLDENVGLAVRRLSIVDLADGRQPLSNEERSVWIAYNGEIFNAAQLRQGSASEGASLSHTKRHRSCRPCL